MCGHSLSRTASLQAFAAAGRVFGPSFVSYCDAIHSTSLSIDASSDVAAFCNEKRSGKTKDNRVVYEPYNPLLQKCSRDGAVATPERRSTVSGAPIPAVRTLDNAFWTRFERARVLIVCVHPLQASKPAPTPPLSNSSSMSTLGRSGGALAAGSSMSTIGRSGGGALPQQPQPQQQQQPLQSSMNSQMFAAPMAQQQQMQYQQPQYQQQQQPLYSSQPMMAQPQQQQNQYQSSSMSMMPMAAAAVVPVAAAAGYQPQSRGIGLCRGVHDYDAAQPSELSFRYLARSRAVTLNANADGSGAGKETLSPFSRRIARAGGRANSMVPWATSHRSSGSKRFRCKLPPPRLQ